MSTSEEIRLDFLGDIADKSAKVYRKQGIQPFLGARGSYHIEQTSLLSDDDLDFLGRIDAMAGQPDTANVGSGAEI